MRKFYEITVVRVGPETITTVSRDLDLDEVEEAVERLLELLVAGVRRNHQDDLRQVWQYWLEIREPSKPDLVLQPFVATYTQVKRLEL